MVTFNAAALSDPNSFICKVNSYPLIQTSFPGLLDCGSSDCFIDPKFAFKHKLQVRSIPPMQLKLLDGSRGASITQAIDLPIKFPCGMVTPITFLVAPLDSTCVVVFGLNWLTRYNPMVDWELRSI